MKILKRILIALTLSFLGDANACAGTITVINTGDSGAGSLRDAVASAVPGDTVTFTNTLSGQTITLTSEIVIGSEVTIGASTLPAGIGISGNGTTRIFKVIGGPVLLESLTLINGNAQTDTNGPHMGGCILNAGVLTVNRCTLIGNIATDGGGICNFSDLTINQSTLTGNQATGSAGGGIYSYSDFTINQSTLVENIASTTGGGVFCPSFAHPNIFNSIVSSNNAATGMDVFADSGINSTGVNIVNDFAGSFNGPPPLNVLPLLAPLGNYGGPTKTMPPLSGSPAINAAGATGFTTDQRGYPRPVGLAADIGAVEGIYNAAGPGTITNITRFTNGSVRLSLTNLTDASFPVLATTNLSQSLSNWTPVGFATETVAGTGLIQFTDPQATNNPQRFYRVKSP